MTVHAGVGEAAEDPRGAQLLALADGFLNGGDAVAAVRAKGASIDDSFASTGNRPFRIPDLADDGSAVLAPAEKASVSPDTLTLVPAHGVSLKLDAVVRRFGKAARIPALPGSAWRYRIAIDEDRSLVAELSGNPTGASARVTKLIASRERN